MDDELLKVRDMAASAQSSAEKAMASIISHEAICAERYASIKDKLTGVPRLFEILEGQNDKMDKQSKLINIAMGFCIAIPTMIEIFHLFIEKR